MSAKASPLASPSATSAVLDRFGLSPKKRFGQNFLIDDGVVQRIVQLSGVNGDDDVLEVGPGIGTLSAALAARARSLVAIERDSDLTEVLEDTMGERSNFQLVMRDALKVEQADIDAAGAALRSRGVACASPNKLVANLPYAVAATVVLDFFQRFSFMKSATVMVQREVAERMRAIPHTKEYGAYTVKLALCAHVVESFRVGPGSFMPQPHVESTVIRLDRSQPVDEEGRPCAARIIRAACEMADAAFFARRKTIANSLRASFTSRGDPARSAVDEMLVVAGIDASVRGETLAPADFIRLGQALCMVRQANGCAPVS